MKRASVVFLSFLLAVNVFAGNGETETGSKPFGSYSGGSIDEVSITNGNLSVHIPLISYPQRGGRLTFAFSLAFNSKGWYLYQQSETVKYWKWGGGGMQAVREGTYKPELVSSQQVCGYEGDPYSCIWIKTYGVRAWDGSMHHTHERATDLSGLMMVGLPPSGYVITRDGIRVSTGGGSGINGMQSEDPNGNKITTSTTGWTDTLGRFLPGSTPTDGSYGLNHPGLLPGAASTTTGCPTGTATARSWTVPAPNGTATIKFCWKTYSLSTNFGVSGIGEGSTTDKLMNAVILPDGTKWLFDYNSYGDLSSITLPTGGTISYTWTTLSAYRASRAVSTRTVNPNDGSPASTWTYTRTTDNSGNVVVSDPNSNDIEYHIWNSTLGQPAWGYYTDRERYFQGNRTFGTLLKTVETTWAGGDYDCDNDYIDAGDAFGPVSARPVTVTTTLQNGKVSKVENVWDVTGPTECIDPVGGYPTGNYMSMSFGSLLETREYDWGQGAPGPLLRKTVKSYIWQSDINYKNNNLLDLVANTQVQDASGNKKAETTFGYDQTSVVSSGVTTQRNATPSSTRRGNQTTASRWLDTTNTYLSRTATYLDTGMLQTKTDPAGHPTTYTYDVTSLKGAYPTQVTAPSTGGVSHSTSANYDFNSGLITTATDDSGQVTTFAYDSSFRVTQKNLPNGGQSSWTYTNVAPLKVTVTEKITGTMNKVPESEIDKLARMKQPRLTSDPEGVVYGDTTYDKFGRVSTTTNPYRSTSEGTYGVNTTEYDALGRPTKTIPADGTGTSNNVSTVYEDNCATVTDQAGKKRKTCSDALGRLTNVYEPNESGSFVYETAYQYDLLGNLIRVDQKGNDPDPSKWRTRTSVYDSLSRLTQVNNPESGTINYAYDVDGNITQKDAPQPNQTNPSVRQYITYCYDELHRQTKKYYSQTTCANGSPDVTYGYDQTSFNGLTITNGKGRRTGMTDASGQTAWSYDANGSVLTERRTISGVTKVTSYTYNLDGSVATVTYPSGRTITYAYNAAGRQISAVDVVNSINYATEASYTAWGALSSVKYGVTGGFTGIVTSNSYNKRLQPIFLTAAAPSQTVLSLGYDFGLNTANNGNVLSVTNNRDPNRSQQFTYDQLNRLASAQTTSNLWGNAYTYDIWGNLLQKTIISGKLEGENLVQAVDGNNRVTGCSYDAAGNQLSDCLGNSFTYDAENRVLTAGGVTYTYDGDGNRVEKSNGTLYWGSLAESDLSGTLRWEFVWFGGKRIARLDLPSGAVHYYFTDHLGSSSVVTNADGTVIQEESDFYPFGRERVITNLLPDQRYRLMGKERDLESGFDFFGARYYSSLPGRWLSPDWSNSPSAVPYATLTNPQTLNLYAFVSNNPANNIDLDGHIGLVSEWTRNRSEQYGRGLTDAELAGCSGSCAQGYISADGGLSAVSEKAQEYTNWWLVGSDGSSTYVGSTPGAPPAPSLSGQAMEAFLASLDNQKVGNFTVGQLARVLTNETNGLTGGTPGDLAKAKVALANTLINNASLAQPNKTAPPTGNSTPVDLAIMRLAYYSRASGGSDPMQGRTYFGTSAEVLNSRPAGNGLKGPAGRQTVYQSFGPFDWGHHPQQYIYIYNDPGH